MRSGEVESATAGSVALADAVVLEEPEADLGRAVVRETVEAVVDDQVASPGCRRRSRVP